MDGCGGIPGNLSIYSSRSSILPFDCAERQRDREVTLVCVPPPGGEDGGADGGGDGRRQGSRRRPRRYPP